MPGYAHPARGTIARDPRPAAGCSPGELLYPRTRRPLRPSRVLPGHIHGPQDAGYRPGRLADREPRVRPGRDPGGMAAPGPLCTAPILTMAGEAPGSRRWCRRTTGAWWGWPRRP